MQESLKLDHVPDLGCMPDDTSIRITRTTKKELETFGKMSDTYEDVIKKLMDEVKECRKIREEAKKA